MRKRRRVRLWALIVKAISINQISTNPATIRLKLLSFSRHFARPCTSIVDLLSDANGKWTTANYFVKLEKWQFKIHQQRQLSILNLVGKGIIPHSEIVQLGIWPIVILFHPLSLVLGLHVKFLFWYRRHSFLCVNLLNVKGHSSRVSLYGLNFTNTIESLSMFEQVPSRRFPSPRSKFHTKTRRGLRLYIFACGGLLSLTKPLRISQ